MQLKHTHKKKTIEDAAKKQTKTLHILNTNQQSKLMEDLFSKKFKLKKLKMN